MPVGGQGIGGNSAPALTPEELAILNGTAVPPPPSGYATEPSGGNDVVYAPDSPDPNAGYAIQDPAATAQPYQAAPALPPPDAAPPQQYNYSAAEPYGKSTQGNQYPGMELKDQAAYGPPPNSSELPTFIPPDQRNHAGMDNIQAAPELNNRSQSQSVGDVVGGAANGAISNLFNWGAQSAGAAPGAAPQNRSRERGAVDEMAHMQMAPPTLPTPAPPGHTYTTDGRGSLEAIPSTPTVDFKAAAGSAASPSSAPTPAADMAWLDSSGFGWAPGTTVSPEQVAASSTTSATSGRSLGAPAWQDDYASQGPLAANPSLGYGPLPTQGAGTDITGGLSADISKAGLPDININIPNPADKRKPDYWANWSNVAKAQPKNDAPFFAVRRSGNVPGMLGALQETADQIQAQPFKDYQRSRSDVMTLPANSQEKNIIAPSVPTPSTPSSGPAFRNVSPTNRLTDPSAVRSQMSGPTQLDANLKPFMDKGDVDPKTITFTAQFLKDNAASLDANGNWRADGPAAKNGWIDPASIGKKASPFDLLGLKKGTPLEAKAATVPEYDPANDANATTAKVDTTTSGSGGSDWVDYGSKSSGGGWKNYGSGGGGGGGGYSGGGYSGGRGGNMADALAFLGDDFMGGRFKDMAGGGDMSWESFLEDMDGDGEFSSTEIKAAKKKSKMKGSSRTRRSKTLSTSSSRSASSSNKDIHTGIRKDILQRVEGMTPKTGKKKSA